MRYTLHQRDMKVKARKVVYDEIEIDEAELVTLADAVREADFNSITHLKAYVFQHGITIYEKPDSYHGRLLLHKKDIEKIKARR